jgi:nuclear GTP-binding protein
MKRISLIDCPGVVPPSTTDTEEDILLRGVVRVENVENPEQYIRGVLRRTQPRHIERTYAVKNYADATGFLSILARKGGRLLKGGEPDVDGVAKMVINDFLRGKIPWFTPPPTAGDGDQANLEGREGRLGEMRGKRKRGDREPLQGEVDETPSVSHPDASEDDFEGFEDQDIQVLEDDGGSSSDEAGTDKGLEISGDIEDGSEGEGCIALS